MDFLFNPVYAMKAEDLPPILPRDERNGATESNELKAKELNDLKAKLNIASSGKLPLTSGCCIYKVPPKLRKVNEEAYNPNVVSIGPYHHRDKRLESMQELKLWYVNRFLKRVPNKSLEESLQDYVEVMSGWEDEIQRCYSETIQMESNEFISMILIDACFIIEFFLECQGLEDPLVIQKMWPTSDIKLDLILLENQLPFFVLTRLFNLAFPSSFNSKDSFDKLTFDFFVNTFLGEIYPNKETHPKFMIRFNHNSFHQVQHLCDVLRTFYLSSNPPPREPHKAMNHSHSVSQLHDAGMEFQVDNDSSVIKLKCFEEIMLKIPCIMVSDWTETMLRNVVALEQCHHPSSGYVTDYVCLLDNLINTGKDVEILARKKIMVNFLGDSNRLASMVNKLCINVLLIETNKDYILLYKEMDKFCDNPYHKYKAIFMREYWSTPWKIASMFAATLLLLLTFIQTISSVNPHH